MNHDHQKQVLQSVVYPSIVRREPAGKSNMPDFPTIGQARSQAQVPGGWLLWCFSYCCSVWGSCGASKLDVLQKLQNKAARIVKSSPFDASAAPLLQRLGWPSVQKLINKETGSMVYRSLNSLAPQYFSDLFVRLSEVHPRELRNSKTSLAIPMLRTGNGQKSFAYRGASLWNSLDLDTKMAPSINAFKSKLKEK